MTSFERESVEAEVRDTLRPLMGVFETAYRFADELLRCMAEAAGAEVGGSGVMTARSHLLSRLADDLRSVWLLAERGYSLQAGGAAATAFEVALTISQIGRSEERATEWLEWEHLTKTPWKVREAAESLAERYGSETAEGVYRWYTMLCLAKHANPRMQRRIPPSHTPAQHFLNAHPEITPATANRIALDLFVPIQITLLGVFNMDGSAVQLPPECSAETAVNFVQAYKEIQQLLFR